MEHQSRPRRQKHIPDSYGIKNYVPYLQTQQAQAGTQANQSTSTQQNTFTPGQQQVQGNLGNLWQSFLQGNIPSSFTNPAAATNAYNSNFNQNIAPGLASTYGAGSPQIASNNALGLAQLQGNLYNTGVNNFMSALTSGSNYGLTPTGATGSNAGFGANTMQGTSTTNMNPLGFLLANIL